MGSACRAACHWATRLAGTRRTRLNLSLNDIAPEGGASLARGLRSNTSLTQLTLVRCGSAVAAARTYAPRVL